MVRNGEVSEPTGMSRRRIYKRTCHSRTKSSYERVVKSLPRNTPEILRWLDEMGTGRCRDWLACTSYSLLAVFRDTLPQGAPPLDYRTPLITSSTLCVITRGKSMRQQRSQVIQWRSR